MIKHGFLIFISVVIASKCFGQHFGNSSYLKYGFTENELSTDVKVHGFTLTNSPSKSFVLRNYNSNSFSVGTIFQPIADNTNGESSGASLKLGNVDMPTGYSFGYRFSTHQQNQAHLTWNKTAFGKKKKMRFRLAGYVYAGKQEFKDDRGGDNWSRQDNTLNGFITLSNFNHAAKNKFRFEGMTIVNSADADPLSGTMALSKNKFDGQVYLGKLLWLRQLSTNHTVNAGLYLERFNQSTLDVFWQGQPRTIAQTNFTQMRFELNDEFTLKKNKVANSIILSDNQTDWSKLGEITVFRYQLAMLNSSLTHFFQPNKIGFKYSQSTGYHSNDGGVFNPGIKFFHKLPGLNYDVGFNQTSRTPALSTEFASFTNFSVDSNQYNFSQETHRRLYTTAKFEINRIFNMEFKYVYTESPNKWMFEPQTESLAQSAFKYSSIHAKVSRKEAGRVRYQLVYRHIIPETSNADILAKHYIHNSIEYRINRRSKRLFHRRVFMDFSCDLNAAYLSRHQLPFMDGENQASHQGGFFADTHLKLRLYNRNIYDYYYNQETKGLKSVVIRLGVNNMLNTRSTLQPIAANHFKPILPRQIVTSIILEI